ncbi:MAG: CAP domain-containing protein [Sphingobium sp.]
MRSQGWRSCIARMVALAATPLIMGAAAPVVPNDFNTRLLNAHNAERGLLGLDAMKWDPKLAASAQKWADYLAATGRFEHAAQMPGNPQGENLWAGTAGYFSPEAMVGAWAEEKQYFKAGRFPDNSTTGDISDVGHYTQMVWRDTGRVGCARAKNGQEEFLVCRYARAGNWYGESPF